MSGTPRILTDNVSCGVPVYPLGPATGRRIAPIPLADDVADVAAMVIDPPSGRVNRTFTNWHFPLCRRHFCDSVLGRAMRAFTHRLSRTLNCRSNLIGHDDPNKPANGTRLIRRGAGGLAIGSWALRMGARSDANRFLLLLIGRRDEQAFQQWTGAVLGGGRQR